MHLVQTRQVKQCRLVTDLSSASLAVSLSCERIWGSFRPPLTVPAQILLLVCVRLRVAQRLNVMSPLVDVFSGSEFLFLSEDVSITLFASGHVPRPGVRCFFLSPPLTASYVPFAVRSESSSSVCGSGPPLAPVFLGEALFEACFYIIVSQQK